MSDLDVITGGGAGNVLLVVFILMTIVFIFGVAISSIGVECYNQNATFATAHPSNKTFMAWSVALSVIGLVMSIIGAVLIIVAKVKKYKID